ncbi:hypothetical protein AURDEDRAFT_129269 [Auricularia subglabra TFB-10046 SS5]|nr:hypothetical protein AURDEDRAFT_129269 [Auricularia subglabra TFB-10046 SS5]
MALNDDILHVVISMDELVAVCGVLERDASLGPLVIEFFQSLSGNELPPSGTPGVSWRQRFGERFGGVIRGILPRLTQLEAIALEGAAFLPEPDKSGLAKTLADLPRLCAVRLHRTGIANITTLGEHAHLKHASISELYNTGLTNWLVAHASTLQTLRLDNCSTLVTELGLFHPTVVFPHLHTIIATYGVSQLSVDYARFFPRLLSLEVAAPLEDIARFCPELEHLRVNMSRTDSLAQLPNISSLHIQTNLYGSQYFHDWVAQHAHLTALIISCTEGGSASPSVLGRYCHLRLLDVHLPDGTSDARTWLLRVAAFTVPQRAWEVLTLRNATGLDALNDVVANALRARAPKLSLLRVLSEDRKKRRLYTWPKQMDWISAPYNAWLPGYFIAPYESAIGAISARCRPCSRATGVLWHIFMNSSVIVRLAPLFPLVLQRKQLRLAALPRLRSLQLPGIDSWNLRIFSSAQTPLQHVSLGDYDQIGLSDWLVQHSATLKSFRIGHCDVLVNTLAQTQDVPIFPHLRSLGSTAATLWPSLVHLDAFMTPAVYSRGMPPYGPAVRSLRLSYPGAVLDAPRRLKHWASPQISALELASGGFAVHAAALKVFTGLRMLDVTLFGDINQTDAGFWLQKAAALPVVPPQWEVVTLRGATGRNELPESPMDVIRGSVPSLRLMRIIFQWPPQRLAFAYLQPVDWLTACEIVADYLPHWRETRAPWDDVRDI